MTLKLEEGAVASLEGTITVRFVDDALICLKSGSEIDTAQAQLRGFAGKVGETMTARNSEAILTLFVGVGAREQLTDEFLRRSGAAAARAARAAEQLVISVDGLAALSDSLEKVVEALGVGLGLASYSFERFRSKGKPEVLQRVIFIDAPAGSLAIPLRRANAIVAAVALARDLVNTPAGDLTPTDFAAIATDVAAHRGLGIEVMDERAIAEARLGGLLGVAQGSVEPPRFVKLTYTPASFTSEATVALVGKGITFDSGGLSLKTGAGMMTMKTDMGGAAAVLGTLSACAALEIGVRVVGYMPLTENMPSGGATKPGDVLVTRSGQTIEVLNTDAEGRLILSDALTLATEDSPDAIIDLATLTGACIVALGSQIAGLLGNDDPLIAQVHSASRRAGEATWPLPLPTGYHSHIESEIADMKNIGATGQAGTISAALLLERFVGSTPWAHLDIAGPARSEEDRGLLRKGGSGFGVRTLLELLEHYEPIGGERHAGAEGITVLP